jgi:hypothetical protein
MTLTLLDWGAIAGYLLLMLLLGVYFRRRSSRNTEEYFVSGRQVAWWLAGTSMVATTFAADTPLVVTGLVYTQGIAGNWLWWSFLPSGMMTVFLFARLWRRSGLLTDVQFAEMRYAGKPAAFLRGFRAVYLGLLMNCLILGWVTKAMTSIVGSALGKSETASLAICIFFLIPFTGFYVSLGGAVGRAVDRSVSIRAENVDRDRGGVLRRAGRGRNARDARETLGHASRGGTRSVGYHCDVSRFFARAYGRSAVDAASAHVSGALGDPVVGVLVSGSGAWRRRATSRRESSVRAMSGTGCFPCCGSTSRITRCGHGRGY